MRINAVGDVDLMLQNGKDYRDRPFSEIDTRMLYQSEVTRFSSRLRLVRNLLVPERIKLRFRCVANAVSVQILVRLRTEIARLHCAIAMRRAMAMFLTMVLAQLRTQKAQVVDLYSLTITDPVRLGTLVLSRVRSDELTGDCGAYSPDASPDGRELHAG